MTTALSLAACRRARADKSGAWADRVHVVPGLRALDKDVGLGAKLAWIVQAADPQPNDIRPSRDANIQWAAAFRAKRASHLVARIAGVDKDFGFALRDAEPGGGYPHGRDIGAAALILAVAAMA
jgi:hypothetical protein